MHDSPEKFLIDSGGDFAHSKSIEMCKALGITVKTTLAESMWSNGFVLLVLPGILDKILEDTMTYPWANSSMVHKCKNTLKYSVHVFSPYQLLA